MMVRIEQRSYLAALWLGLSMMCGACPNAADSRPAQNCSKAYDKCVLASGVLGVCDVVDCPTAQNGPCLICRSQH